MDHQEIAYIVKRVLTESSSSTKELLEKFEKSIRDREDAMVVEEVVDEPDEQFLTMECFEAISYYYTDTSRTFMKFSKPINIKDI